MARPVSTIESHPQKAEIIAALAAEQPYRVIEKWTEPRVTIGSLSRFKSRTLTNLLAGVTSAQSAVRHAIANKDDASVSAAARAVTGVALASAVDPFVQIALRSAARRERWMDDLEAQPELDTYKVLATLDRNDLAAQEYQARLAGRLDNVTTLNVAVVLPAQPGPAQPSDWDGVTLDIKASK